MKIAPVVLLIVFVAHYSDALSCYDCVYSKTGTGTNTENCGEDFDSSGVKVVDCDGGCYKYAGKNKNGDGITRGCAPKSYLNGKTSDACETGSNELGEGTACICFSDKCNDGKPVTSLALMTLFIGVSAAMIFGN